MSSFCSNCGTVNRDNTKFCSNCGNSFFGTSSRTNLSLGSLLDRRYEISSLIKSGGMGCVYKARDVRLKRDCAVKEMFGDHENPEDQKYAIKRFEEEAYILAHLTHSNLPTLMDYFVEAGRYYLVMEFIDGTDLDELLKREGKPGLLEERVLKYAIQILDVLEYLHRQSPPIIYRDIKPSNIMIRSLDDRVMVVDFGIARAIQVESKTRKTIIGTPGYLAPEQWKGNVETRSDLYSLGATMHHLLSGVKPEGMEFKPLTVLVENLSTDVESVVMKSLKEKPEDRYASATEMKEAIKFLRNKPTAKIPLKDQRGKCYNCKKVFLVSDLIHKDEKMYCLECNVQVTQAVQEKAVPTRIMLVETTKSIIHTKDNSEMLLIPKGPFTMGSNIESDEKPIHEVLLDDYYLDKYLVTNEQYKKFVDDTGYISEGSWLKYCSSMKINYPVVGVSWNDAMAYARWAGKSIPTEAEWEKAAKGSDNREYPWGKTWDKNKCNNRKMDIGELVEDMVIMLAGRGTVPTGSFPEGSSPYGVMDMAGNVNEWCLDWYSNKYYSVSPDRNPPGASSGSWKVIRGGSWWDESPKAIRTCARNGDHPGNSKATIGFRCVKRVM